MTEPSEPTEPTLLDDQDDQLGLRFWALLVVGAVFVIVGARGILHDQDRIQAAELGRWFIGAGVAHDAVLAPLFVTVGLLTRVVPERARIPIRIALAASAIVSVFAWPLVQGWGRRDANPSALPLDYGRNLAGALVAIWVAALVAVIVGSRRHPR
jgi:Na+-translocating ferredoxin:NAD+ oxidoreductase RnfE subunit